MKGWGGWGRGGRGFPTAFGHIDVIGSYRRGARYRRCCGWWDRRGVGRGGGGRMNWGYGMEGKQYNEVISTA